MNLSILVTYSGDRLEQFQRSLHSIYYQSADFNGVELLVLNDGGSPDVYTLLKRYSGKFQIRYFTLKNKEKTYHNSAARRNFLIRKARGKHVVITDPEIVHATNSIDQIRRAIETYGDAIWYCGAVYATSSVVRKDGGLAFADRKPEKHIHTYWGPATNNASILNMSYFARTRAYTKINPAGFKEFFWCTAIPKKELLRVQGCNEDFSTYGYEDIDLFNRLYAVGVRRIYDEAFIVYHLPHPVFLSPAQQRFWFIHNQYVPKRYHATWGILQNVSKEIHI